jgi:peptidoglycan/xylan/chitin deacetylase (PgdA/CDA1 family)
VQINENKSSIFIEYGNETCERAFIIKIREEELRDDEFEQRILQQFEKGTGDIKSGVKYSEKGIEVWFDIFKEIGYFLSGKFDEVLPNLNLEQRKIFSRKPIIDIYEKTLFDLLLYACQKSDVPLVQKAFWPNDKRFAVCLTHDVDELRKTYQYFTRSVRHLKNTEFKRAWYHLKSFFTDKLFGKNPYWTFDNIMRLENELKVKSTFFFLKETAKVNIFRPGTWIHYARRYDLQNPKVAELIKELASNGWEVGLHGSYESYLNVDKLRKEKEYLEETLGSTIYGIRQHHLNLKIPETWKYQEEIGLEYDTSLGFKGGEDIGFRWGTCFPFHPYDNGKAMSILEIPLTIMDISLTLNTNKDMWEDCMDVVNEVEKYGGVLTLLWHHTVFNNEEYPGWAEMYERIIKVCKEKNAWISNAGEIAKWWKMREESNLEWECKEKTLKVNSSDKGNAIFVNAYLPFDMNIELLSPNIHIIKKKREQKLC